jgi:putative oxidoreductase
MNNDRYLAFAGRLLIAVIFLLAGFGKLMGYAGTVGYFGKLGIPFPEAVVALSILVELGGGILLVIGYRLVVVASVMAAFTFGAALIGHQFWNATDPTMHMQQMNNFLKNVAMVGGFLMVIVDARRRSGA